MYAEVLGPLQITANTMSHPVKLSPKPRTILALLIADAGRVVPASLFLRELWEQDPPVSAQRNVQTYISQVRKALSQVVDLSVDVVARTVLMTRPGGYVFGQAATTCDHRIYRDLVAEGQDAMRRGDHEHGIDILERALALWRGPAFVDVATGPVLEAKRRQLEQTRMSVIEVISSAKISLGRYHEAVADLAAVVYENPLHEGLHYQYIRALGMAGDRARALTAFRCLRANLVTELGIEPSDSIRALQTAILSQHT